VAITLDNTDPSIFNDRGIAYQSTQRYAEALEDFQTALRLSPKNAKYAEQCGNSLWYLNRVREAWDSYNQAVILDPGRASAWRSRGDCYKHLGDAAAAQRDYAQASKLERK
jgi:Flp pilus assembly protein TadD